MASGTVFNLGGTRVGVNVVPHGASVIHSQNHPLLQSRGARNESGSEVSHT